jgi:hypothetical protein
MMSGLLRILDWEFVSFGGWTPRTFLGVCHDVIIQYSSENNIPSVFLYNFAFEICIPIFI